MSDSINLTIAIDGPSGAGKSTVSRRVAARFDFIHVDTGAIYRAIGLYVRDKGVEPKDETAVKKLLPDININVEYNRDEGQKIFLNGRDVSSEIRRHEISAYASDVSALPCVRDFLLSLQRRLASGGRVVMDGRDIGTVVLPDAGLKIYLTASPQVRARRRHNELIEKGETTEYNKVLADIERRDLNDSTRAIAPLKRADDAVLIDTSNKELDESCELVFSIVSERFGI